MMFSITGSQIFLVDFIIFTKSEQKPAYWFIVHTISSYKVYFESPLASYY